MANVPQNSTLQYSFLEFSKIQSRMLTEPFISIWGPVAAGKTVYLASLVLALSNSQHEKWRIWPRNSEASGFKNHMVTHLANGQFAEATARPYELQFDLYRNNSLLGNHIIRIWDTMGGMFQYDADYRSSALGGDDSALFRQSHGMLLMIDPTCDYRGEVGNHLNAKLQEFFNNLAAAHLTDKGHLDISIAICLTKMDQFWLQKSEPKKLLETLLNKNSLNLISNVCDPKRLRFFSTSAVGCYQTPDDPHRPNIDPDKYCIENISAWKPYGITEPFIWLLQDIEKQTISRLPFWKRFSYAFHGRNTQRLPLSAYRHDLSQSGKTEIEAQPKRVNATSVFISYSRKDWDNFVYPLVEHLKEDGFDVWLDQDLIEGGDDWLDAINDALRVCERMIVCISPNSLSSKYVRMEYRYFIDNNKKLIPLMCVDTQLPAELIRINYIKYSNYEGLISSLKKKDGLSNKSE